MEPGKNVTIVSGSRLRRISEDNKRLLDQTMQEGAIVEYDTPAKVKGVVHNADGGKTAYVLEVKHSGAILTGWCYAYEISPTATQRR